MAATGIPASAFPSGCLKWMIAAATHRNPNRSGADVTLPASGGRGAGREGLGALEPQIEQGASDDGQGQEERVEYGDDEDAPHAESEADAEGGAGTHDPEHGPRKEAVAGEGSAQKLGGRREHDPAPAE